MGAGASEEKKRCATLNLSVDAITSTGSARFLLEESELVSRCRLCQEAEQPFIVNKKGRFICGVSQV